jgi:hypothetical protein
MSLRSRSQHTFPQIFSPESHSPKNSKEDYVRLVIQHAWLEESCTFFSPKKLEEDLGSLMHARKRLCKKLCTPAAAATGEAQLHNLP